MEISFEAEGIEMPDFDRKKVVGWIRNVAGSHNRIVGRISYIFTDDDGILHVNREFLQHDYYTDIITFDYSRRRLISGDIYISLDTVKSNAQLFGTEYDRELYRVIIHGVLHLCGINDKGPGEREIMESHEDAALSRLEVLNR